MNDTLASTAHGNDTTPSSLLQTSTTGEETFEDLFRRADLPFLESFFANESRLQFSDELSKKVSQFLVEISLPGRTQDAFNLFLSDVNLNNDPEKERIAKRLKRDFFEKESKVQSAFRMFRKRYPTQIWLCCEARCFATIATDPIDEKVFDELDLIHDSAEKFHTAAEKLDCYLEKRRKGVGTSNVGFTSQSRAEREAAAPSECETRRVIHMRNFVKFVLEVLPYLYGEVKSPRGTSGPRKKLCTQAICCLLGVSRNFLYNRHTFSNLEEVSEEQLISVVDIAGLRMRQHRRTGSRQGYPAVASLNTFDCGCDIPCFSSVPIWSLFTEYGEFSKLSVSLRPRHKENRFLLNRMYCPLTNITTHVCNRALSALYTVSTALIAEVRRVLNAMCEDSECTDRDLLHDGTSRYNYYRGHPMNRYRNWVREKIENTLDMVVRPDPSGPNGGSVCRVYSPEINTQEKLREVIQLSLEKDEGVDVDLSPSCLQRMVNDYLERKKYKRICFTQSDHNACPTCKTLQYAILQYNYEAKLLQRQLDRSGDGETRQEELRMALATKTYQEKESVAEMNHHNERDARIRKFIKKLSDFFRKEENKDIERNTTERNATLMGSKGWNSLPGRACITHQDDMTKVDLPSVVVSASSDITRWRFDVNAHVSAITNEAVVFSHEQGSGAKNASSIVEEILLHHILRCKGEAIKVVISDNASVGKNWVTTVALPQYMVDQGLAEVVMVVFLENNHGKWLADMLFGQFQSRRKRSVLLGIDGMMSEFERIKRRNENVQSFALNPLSSVDFAESFGRLGYATKPPGDFGFTKRNIHFATACAHGAKEHMHEDLLKLIGPALPEEPGMVRVSTEPPGFKSQEELYYEDRYIDVPASKCALTIGTRRGRGESVRSTAVPVQNILSNSQGPPEPPPVPLVVPLNKAFAEHGNGVVSSRTADKVGFNGIVFRDSKSFPEMLNTCSPLVRRAWPKGLLVDDGNAETPEHLDREETMKCAPLNWIVRRPVSRYCTSDMDWKARYPPVNMLNAKYRQGPRVCTPWTPCATYLEPPFPIMTGTAAESAMEMLALSKTNIGESVHFLEALHAVYYNMGDRDGVSDPWLQKRVTEPRREAVEKYRKEMNIYSKREKGHPLSAKTLRQLFREDSDKVREAQGQTAAKGLTGSAATKFTNQTLTKMFVDAESSPGTLAKYRRMMRADVDRYSRELKNFRQNQRHFDMEHGLLPKSTQSTTLTRTGRSSPSPEVN